MLISSMPLTTMHNPLQSEPHHSGDQICATKALCGVIWYKKDLVCCLNRIDALALDGTIFYFLLTEFWRPRYLQWLLTIALLLI